MCTVLDETKTEGQFFTPVGIVSMILDSVVFVKQKVYQSLVKKYTSNASEKVYHFVA